MKITELAVGISIFHNGIPYRLIRMIWRGPISTKWIVQPLFVEQPEKELVICHNDELHLAQFHPKTAA